MNSLTLKWTEPLFNGLNITRYDVLYKRKDDTEWTKRITNENKMEFYGLDWGTVYQFQVIAWNSEGYKTSNEIRSVTILGEEMIIFSSTIWVNVRSNVKMSVVYKPLYTLHDVCTNFQ